jgi:hypothetical protein
MSTGKDQTFREGHLVYTLKGGKGREYLVHQDDDFIGTVLRINPYGIQSFWNAIDPSGRIIGRAPDRTIAAQLLERHDPE